MKFHRGRRLGPAGASRGDRRLCWASRPGWPHTFTPGMAVWLALELALAVREKLRERDGDREGEGDVDPVPSPLGEALPLPLQVIEDEGDADPALRVPLPLGDGLRDTLELTWLSLGLTEEDGDGEEEGEGLPPAWLLDGDTEGDGTIWLPDPDDENEGEDEGETDTDSLAPSARCTAADAGPGAPPRSRGCASLAVFVPVVVAMSLMSVPEAIVLPSVPRVAERSSAAPGPAASPWGP